jgi:hypothetical protein
MELLAAQRTPAGTIRVTLGRPTGVEVLEGSPDEIAALCDAMEQMCVLAGAADDESAWLAALPVGADIVRLGLSRGGRVRLVVQRAA